MLTSGSVPEPGDRFLIQVVDTTAGRGVPAVRVSSPNGEYWSDSNGFVSFYDPALINQTVTFDMGSHGYELVGGPGSVDLNTNAGTTAQIEVEPVSEQIAQRVYRLTGAGIYRDSVLSGQPTPLENPVLNGLVMGQDASLSVLYNGMLFWNFGDTNRPSYPLGSFKGCAAVSVPPDFGGLDPEAGVDLEYYLRADGFCKEIAPSSTVPNPPGQSQFIPAWIVSLGVVPDLSQNEHLFGTYWLVENLSSNFEEGVVRFNDSSELFEKILIFDAANVVRPLGRAFSWSNGGTPYFYFRNGVRIPATEAAMLDPNTYQTFTALQQGSSSVLDRDADDKLLYSWKSGTAAITQEMIDGGLEVAVDEALIGNEREPDTGYRPKMHIYGRTAWNPCRKRFVRFKVEVGAASSQLGEIWYAEADTPVGPWVYARKVVTHDAHTFYNPTHHYELDKLGGQIVFFDATYATFFADGAVPTPFYDYNTIMYKLDLNDERLVMPVPVYDLSAGTIPGDVVTKAGLRPGMTMPKAAFMAWEHPVAGSLPVHWSGVSCGGRSLVVVGTPGADALFYALPPDTPNPPPDTRPLFEYVNTLTGEHAYSVDSTLGLADLTLVTTPIALVWVNPLSVDFPVIDYLAPHIADAGAEICVTEDSPGAGSSMVVFDGSASSHTGASRQKALAAIKKEAKRRSVALPKGYQIIAKS